MKLVIQRKRGGFILRLIIGRLSLNLDYPH